MLTASPSAESVYKHLEAGYDPPTKPSSTELDDSHRSTPIPESKLESDGDQQAHDLYLVDWDEGEAANPRNWSTFRKSWITFQLGMLALAAAAGSSIISPAQMVISRELGISEEVAVLALSLYILGFAFGPLIWAPLSEVWGRKVSMLPAMMGLALFSIGVAQSRNPQTLFICRFLSGIFGAAPVSNCTPALGDVWSPKARGMAVTFYAVAGKCRAQATQKPSDSNSCWRSDSCTIDRRRPGSQSASRLALDRVHPRHLGVRGYGNLFLQSP